MMQTPINLVLYSPGLGYINRGLETFTQELYLTLRREPELNLSLFQGRGEVLDGAKVVWAPHRNANFYDLQWFQAFKQRSYQIENWIFSIPLVAHCYSHPSTLIHFSETIPANILYHLRRRLGGSFKLLFSNGGPILPQHYSRYDYVQVLTPAQKQEGLEFGYPENRLFLVPYGLSSDRFCQNLSPEVVALERQQRNLPVHKSIILAVGAINTSHKRMDWLVQEFAKLDPDQFFLWIVGQPELETQAVQDLATALLKPDTYRFDVVPYDQMPRVYAIANYFALGSLLEGFGRVYLEAMAAGLPTIAHRNLNTEWILGVDNLGLIDMTQPDALKNKVLYFEQQENARRQQAIANQAKVIRDFDWIALSHQYMDMYRQIISQD